MGDFKRQYFEQLKQEEDEQILLHQDTIQEFQAKLKLKGVTLSSDNFRYIDTIGIVAEYPGLLSILTPELHKDKDELYDFNILDNAYKRRPMAAGLLFSESYIAMAHQYFRRGFHDGNNFAPRFVELYWAFRADDIQQRIALDPDRVRLDISNYGCLELDTWYGPSFNLDIATISDGVAKLRPPLDLDEFHVSFFFRDAYALDVKWSTKGKIKTFQAEEIKTEKVKVIKDGEEYFPARYIHAEYDLNAKSFRHFDGAIHFYTHEEYFQRRDSDFNVNEKIDAQIKTMSQKLFRLDGIIEVKDWISFSGHFFSGNPLVIEYFDGHYPEHIEKMLRKVRAARNNE